MGNVIVHGKSYASIINLLKIPFKNKIKNEDEQIFKYFFNWNVI